MGPIGKTRHRHNGAARCKAIRIVLQHRFLSFRTTSTEPLKNLVSRALELVFTGPTNEQTCLINDSLCLSYFLDTVRYVPTHNILARIIVLVDFKLASSTHHHIIHHCDSAPAKSSFRSGKTSLYHCTASLGKSVTENASLRLRKELTVSCEIIISVKRSGAERRIARS